MKPLDSGASYLSRLFIVSSFIIVIVLIGSSPPLIHAEFFGVVLDNTCLTMHKYNISSNCPTYEDILTIYPDTSNHDISGYFDYKDGIYQRTFTKIHNSHEYYRFSDNVFFVDPPIDTRDKIKIIEIRANLKNYLLPDKRTFDSENRTLTMGKNRYIENCYNAYINSEFWINLLGDTINHINNNCSKESTRYNDTFTTQLNKTVHDISTSYKWKLELWQKEMINRCGFKVCLYAANQTQPEKHE